MKHLAARVSGDQIRAWSTGKNSFKLISSPFICKTVLNTPLICVKNDANFNSLFWHYCSIPLQNHWPIVQTDNMFRWLKLETFHIHNMKKMTLWSRTLAVPAQHVYTLQTPCTVWLTFERIIYQQKISGRDTRVLVTGCCNTHAAEIQPDSADVLGAKRLSTISASFILFSEMRSLDKEACWFFVFALF